MAWQWVAAEVTMNEQFLPGFVYILVRNVVFRGFPVGFWNADKVLDYGAEPRFRQSRNPDCREVQAD